MDGQFLVVFFFFWPVQSLAKKRKFSSHTQNGRVSESERTRKKRPRDISGCEHLDSARAAEVSDSRQREQAVAHLSSTHSIILLFFLHPLRFFLVLAVALIRRRRQSDHVSRARAHLVSSSPRRASLCMRNMCVSGPRCCLQALTRGQRSSPCYVFNEAVGGGSLGRGHPVSRGNLN